jgi:tripartite-type tricarboxylate transporter receptor subunit TctC
MKSGTDAMPMKASRNFLLAFIAAAFLCGNHTQAQQWPQNNIKLVVSAAAGGPIDVFARVIAESVAPMLKQSVIVENIAGAGGAIGGQHVARAAPDGYTLLLGTSATHTFSQLLYKKPLYDAETEFASIGLMAEIPLVIITRKDLPAENLSDFVRYAKANASKMNFGSAGVGSSTHLGCALLTSAIGAEINHVPYRGTAPAMQDLIAGRIDFLCEIVVTAAPQIDGNNVKAIATMALERSPVLPNVPTTIEGGFSNLKAESFTALFAPRGTPRDVVEKMNSAMMRALDLPETRAKLEKLGASIAKPDRRTPTYLDRFVGEELTKWRKIVEGSGIQPQ